MRRDGGGGTKRMIHGETSLRLPRAYSSVSHSRVVRSPSASGTCGLPSELVASPRRVDHAPHDVAGSGGAVDGRAARSGGPSARRVELVDARLDPRPDVEDAAVVADGSEDPADDVGDVDEVARLLAVSVDRRRLPAADALEEDRDDTSLERRRLPRPVHVREAERDVAGAEQPVPPREVLLAGQLREAVWGDRATRRVLARRSVALPVDRPARRAEDDLRAVRAGRLQHADGADDVHVRVIVGTLDRCADVGLRRQVEADLGLDLVEDGRGVRPGCRPRAASRRARRRPAIPSPGCREREPRRRARGARRRGWNR